MRLPRAGELSSNPPLHELQQGEGHFARAAGRRCAFSRSWIMSRIDSVEEIASAGRSLSSDSKMGFFLRIVDARDAAGLGVFLGDDADDEVVFVVSRVSDHDVARAATRRHRAPSDRSRRRPSDVASDPIVVGLALLSFFSMTIDLVMLLDAVRAPSTNHLTAATMRMNI